MGSNILLWLVERGQMLILDSQSILMLDNLVEKNESSCITIKKKQNSFLFKRTSNEFYLLEIIGFSFSYFENKILI